MGLMDWVRARRGLTLEAVRREAIRLDIRERQKLAKLEALEREREAIFHRGSQERSPVRRRQLARQYELRTRTVGQLERELAILSKEITTIGALQSALERTRLGREGAGRLLMKMDEAELATLLEDEKISSELYLEKLGDVLGVVQEDGRSIVAELGQEGGEVMNIWQKMDEGEIESFEDGIRQAREAEVKKDRGRLEREG
jgi:hypothetical protein